MRNIRVPGLHDAKYGSKASLCHGLLVEVVRAAGAPTILVRAVAETGRRGRAGVVSKEVGSGRGFANSELESINQVPVCIRIMGRIWKSRQCVRADKLESEWLVGNSAAKVAPAALDNGRTSMTLVASL